MLLQCVFGVFRVDLLYRVCLIPSPPKSDTLLHRLNHSFFFSISLLSPHSSSHISFLSLSHFSVLALPLTSLQTYKAAPLSTLPQFLALFPYISLAGEAKEGQVFTASHGHTPSSVQMPHKSASQHATGTELECPALICPSRPLQEPTVSFASTHPETNAQILYSII